MNPNQIAATQSYAQITAAIATASASLLPTITVDGITIDRAGYLKTLLDAQALALKAMQTSGGPFTITSTAR